MYPIDLLKVSLLVEINRARTTATDVKGFSIDAHASGESDSRGDIHGHWQCHFHHFQSRGLHVAMARPVQCRSRSWCATTTESFLNFLRLLTIPPLGPAHAVYFATYEVVKQAMGGNASGHHPVAAGKHLLHLLPPSLPSPNSH
jgi:hypothetical protein